MEPQKLTAALMDTGTRLHSAICVLLTLQEAMLERDGKALTENKDAYTVYCVADYLAGLRVEIDRLACEVPSTVGGQKKEGETLS